MVSIIKGEMVFNRELRNGMKTEINESDVINDKSSIFYTKE